LYIDERSEELFREIIVWPDIVFVKREPVIWFGLWAPTKNQLQSIQKISFHFHPTCSFWIL